MSILAKTFDIPKTIKKHQKFNLFVAPIPLLSTILCAKKYDIYRYIIDIEYGIINKYLFIIKYSI